MALSFAIVLELTQGDSSLRCCAYVEQDCHDAPVVCDDLQPRHGELDYRCQSIDCYVGHHYALEGSLSLVRLWSIVGHTHS